VSVGESLTKSGKNTGKQIARTEKIEKKFGSLRKIIYICTVKVLFEHQTT